MAREFNDIAGTDKLEYELILGSTVANSGNNVFADITGLTFAVTSGLTYGFRAQIIYTSAATTTGARFSVNGPSITRLFYVARWTLTATSMNAEVVASTYDQGTASATSSAGANIAIIEGTVTPSASGTFAMRFANEVNASAITCQPGSHLRYWFV